MGNEKELIKVNTIFNQIDYKIPIEDRLKQAKEVILNSNDAVTIGFQLKYLTKFIEELWGGKDAKGDKEVKEHITKQTEAFLKGNPNFKGVAYTTVHSYYKFENCNHPELNELYKIKETVEKRIKTLETELKNIAVAMENEAGKAFKDGEFSLNSGTKNVLVEYTHELKTYESSEAVTIYPPVAYKTMGLKYFLNKVIRKK